MRLAPPSAQLLRVAAGRLCLPVPCRELRGSEPHPLAVPGEAVQVAQWWQVPPALILLFCLHEPMAAQPRQCFCTCRWDSITGLQQAESGVLLWARCNTAFLCCFSSLGTDLQSQAWSRRRVSLQTIAGRHLSASRPQEACMATLRASADETVLVGRNDL